MKRVTTYRLLINFLVDDDSLVRLCVCVHSRSFLVFTCKQNSGSQVQDMLHWMLTLWILCPWCIHLRTKTKVRHHLHDSRCPGPANFRGPTFHLQISVNSTVSCIVYVREAYFICVQLVNTSRETRPTWWTWVWQRNVSFEEDFLKVGLCVCVRGGGPTNTTVPISCCVHRQFIVVAKGGSRKLCRKTWQT